MIRLLNDNSTLQHTIPFHATYFNILSQYRHTKIWAWGFYFVCVYRTAATMSIYLLCFPIGLHSYKKNINILQIPRMCGKFWNVQYNPTKCCRLCCSIGVRLGLWLRSLPYTIVTPLYNMIHEHFSHHVSHKHSTVHLHEIKKIVSWAVLLYYLYTIDRYY